MAKARPPRTWTCSRVRGGMKCGHKNPARYKICRACGKSRPAKKRKAHLVGLDTTYEDYIILNGGEFCAICGFLPGAKRRLDRDHDHETGEPRGLLCPNCNRRLWNGIGIPWVKAALAYLIRVQNRKPR